MERLLLTKTGCWLASSARCLIFAKTSLLTIELGYNSKPHVFAILLKCTLNDCTQNNISSSLEVNRTM